MEERQVTIEGTRYPLDPPFMVLATQNPVEYEGTYPLPEAQLDRFLFKVVVAYPPEEAEREIVRRYHQGFDAHRLDASGLQAVVKPADLPAYTAQIVAVTVEDGILAYITQIANATRRSPDLILGGSPRASHCHAAGGQDLCGAARPRLRDARRCQSRAAADLSPSHHPAPGSGDRGAGCRRRNAAHCGKRAGAKIATSLAKEAFQHDSDDPQKSHRRRPAGHHRADPPGALHPAGWPGALSWPTQTRGRDGPRTVTVHREMASVTAEAGRRARIGGAIVATIISLTPAPLYLYCADHNERYYLPFGFHPLTRAEMPRSLCRIYWIGNTLLHVIAFVTGKPRRLVVMGYGVDAA